MNTVQRQANTVQRQADTCPYVQCRVLAQGAAAEQWGYAMVASGPRAPGKHKATKSETNFKLLPAVQWVQLSTARHYCVNSLPAETPPCYNCRLTFLLFPDPPNTSARSTWLTGYSNRKLSILKKNCRSRSNGRKSNWFHNECHGRGATVIICHHIWMKEFWVWVNVNLVFGLSFQSIKTNIILPLTGTVRI